MLRREKFEKEHSDSISLIFIVIGCSSEEERVISKLKSEFQDKYSIVIFDDKVTSEDKATSGEIQRRINDLMDANKLWDKVPSLKYIVVDENSSNDFDYKEVFSLNEFPEIFVFDNKGIVLRTNKVEELEELLLN